MVAPLANCLSDEEALRIHSHLIQFLRACRVSEPDEIAQEALVRILGNIRMGLVIDNALAYARRVAYHVVQEDRRNRRRETPLDLEIVAPEPPASDEEMLDCLKSCQRLLSRADRKILRRFEEADAQGRVRMAEEMGISRNALGLRVHQIRSQLRACVEACLKERRTK